jgi:Uma2 family endonuclease
MPNGVQVAWLIDLKGRTVTIYRPDDEPETLFDPTSVQGSGPMRGFELVMSRIWG